MIYLQPGSCTFIPSKLHLSSTSLLYSLTDVPHTPTHSHNTISIAAQETLNDRKPKEKPVLQEKIGSNRIRRYLINSESKSLIVKDIKVGDTGSNEAVDVGESVQLKDPFFNITLSQFFVNFFLPAGFPGSVSDDYLEYMIWQFPTNVSGWICRTLITSSLLKAVGISAGPASTAAATAAIKWVTKDGLGALGRLFIGGRFGSLFDEDPKQWRMYADLIGSGGGIFELATPLAPDYFLILASLGNLTKAIAKGLKDPSFRVIQNHFARMENVGDVSAKEEVWEVVGQLVGLGLGVYLLATPNVAASYPNLVISWAIIRLLHLWLRHQSLTSLKLSTVNFKRASILVQSHVQGVSIPGCIACNTAENILLPWQWKKPSIQIGCSLQDIAGTNLLASEVMDLLDIYKHEQYILTVHPNTLGNLEARVVLKEGANSVTILRSMWQAYWLLSRDIVDPEKLQGSTVSQIDKLAASMFSKQQSGLIRSLSEMKERFSSFLRELDEVGWELSKVVMRIPPRAPILSKKIVFSENDY